MDFPFYSEYNAWLQPKSRLQSYDFEIFGENADEFVMNELHLGLKRVFGGKADNAIPAAIYMKTDPQLGLEAYSIKQRTAGEIEISGGSRNGMLYGVYRFLNLLSAGENMGQLSEASEPAVEFRVINHWDNIDGHIERGYAGNSIFFSDNQLSYSPKQIEDYARLLASVGINSISINNVNVTEVSAKLMTRPLIEQVAKIADIFRPFGIRLLLSVHFDSPVILGGLKTADPLDESVKCWWSEQAALIYEIIPDFLGFLVKADSEFRMGPEALGRTQADGANTLAAALEPYGGTVFWRCFVYNCQQDWRDKKIDRPMAAYEHFQPLDGMFAKNVILQIKFGPMDFQVREPLSPLISALQHTREAIEYQITQEYTGHQIDLYGLPVQWQEILESDVEKGRPLKGYYGNKIHAACAVSNVGRDKNWTGHTLAQCNMYAFGRMAWNPQLTAETVVEEWTKLTFETGAETQNTIKGMILRSRHIYEKYTAPLGIGFMVTPHFHYGPSVEGYEFSKWGTYHRANQEAIGVDRTSAGTGYTKQYPPEIMEMFDNIETCPEELLLFFHRARYDYKLKNGKTLLQHIYDSHFEGAEEAAEMLQKWQKLDGLVPEETYQSVLRRLKLQEIDATEWRDVINTYFFRKSGINDEKSRVIFE